MQMATKGMTNVEIPHSQRPATVTELKPILARNLLTVIEVLHKLFKCC